ACVVILGIVWIPVMRGMGNVLYRYLQNVQGLLAPAIAAVFVLGVFWKRATAAGGLAGLSLGFALGMFRLGLDVVRDRLTPGSLLYQAAAINWLHVCELLFILCVLTIIVVSLLTQPPTEKMKRYTYGAATTAEKLETRKSWNGWDVLHTAIILSVIVAFYIYFW
ncbi:MAG: Na+/glucose cotransporter, partial [Acidobacteria bacterium]